jgi:hypothetical protein
MRKILLPILFLTVFGAAISPVRADMNISASPLNGSDSIRFGRVDFTAATNAEVHLRFTSTDGKPYQVFQRLIDPIVNEQGQTAGSEAVQTYTRNKSNSYGTIYLNSPGPLSSGEQLIYSSSGAGQSDDVTIVYKIQPERVGAQGDFTGRVMYTVRSAHGGGQQSTFLTISFSGGEEFKSEMKGSTSIDQVTVKYDDGKIEDGSVGISFSGNQGQDVRIYQEVVSIPQNEIFSEMEPDVLVFRTGGSGEGDLKFSSFEPLARKKSLLYESKTSADEFELVYSFNQEAIKNQKAGTFRGNVDLIVETGDKTEKYRIHLEAQIQPIFRLEVTLPPGGVKFGKILPDSPPQEQEVGVAVRTNLQVPYIVFQNIGSSLTNAAGDVIPKDYFTLKVLPDSEDHGKVSPAEYAPVRADQQPIFFSDTRGNSSTFKVVYRLKSFPMMRPGEYTTSIKYSLGEK